MANQIRLPNLGVSSGLPLAHMLTFPIQTMTQTTLGAASGGPCGKSPLPIGAEKSWHYLGWIGRRFLLLLFIFTSWRLGSWLLEYLAFGGSRVPPLQIRLPPPGAFSFTYVVCGQTRLELVLLPQIMGHQLLLGTQCLNI